MFFCFKSENQPNKFQLLSQLKSAKKWLNLGLVIYLLSSIAQAGVSVPDQSINQEDWIILKRGNSWEKRRNFYGLFFF